MHHDHTNFKLGGTWMCQMLRTCTVKWLKVKGHYHKISIHTEMHLVI